MAGRYTVQGKYRVRVRVRMDVTTSLVFGSGSGDSMPDCVHGLPDAVIADCFQKTNSHMRTVEYKRQIYDIKDFQNCGVG
jgi:hypothetical protein